MSKRNRQPRQQPVVSRSLVQKDLHVWKWVDHIESLALGRMEWKGLPPSIDQYFLEKVLMQDGKAVAFSMDGLPMATRVTNRGRLNVYDEYTQYQSIGSDNWRYNIEDGEGIMIYDSLTKRSKAQILDLFAYDLAEIDVIARANLIQQRNLTIITGPAENKADLQALARALDQNEESFIAIKNFTDNTKVEALRTEVPYLQDEFHQDRISKLNMLYNILGIENIPFEKSERLVAGEASIGNDAIARIREDALLPRKKAAAKMSEMFEMEITVDWRNREYEELAAEAAEEEEILEGEERDV